jgi:metallo-beta-lactamase family protein
MAEAGRILHHLKNNVEDEKNTILIVSWQAPHTPGNRSCWSTLKLRVST